MNWSTGQQVVKKTLLVLSLLALGGDGAAQMPDLRAPQPTGALAPGGTGLIAGQVLDPGTNKPVPEALVTLWPNGAMEFGPRIMADGQGRFVFVNAPAGRYRIQAQKFGFITGYHGERAVNGTSSLVDVADGQILTDLVVPAWKSGAITGTVTDEAGQPVVGVRVGAFRKTVWMGEVRLVPQDPFNTSATTDDRGMYRLSNLPPAEYSVAVPTTLTTFAAESMQATQETGPVRSQAFFTLRDLPTPLGDPLTQQAGASVLVTGNGTVIPPASPSGDVSAVYRTTFAPGTPVVSEAAMVALGSGEERTLDIALRPSRAVRVSGRLDGPDGPAAHTPIRMLPTGQGRLTLGSAPLENATATALTDASGGFTFLGVPDGNYVVMMRTGERDNVVSATESVTVGGTDVLDLVMTARPAPRITGRVDLRAGKAPENQLRGVGGASLYVFGEALDSGRFSVLLAPLGPELRFAASAAPGRYVLTPQAPAGLWCTAVTRQGRDITDEILVVQSEDIDLTVVCGEPATRLSGKVRKEDGAADPEAAIVAFPADRASWSGPTVRPRRLKEAYTSTDGAFTLANLPAGDYFVAAIPIARSELWRDPKFLDQLTRSATRTTLTQGESRTIDLRTVQIR
jgi:hypothetical protein